MAPATLFDLSSFKLQTDLPKCPPGGSGVREIKWPEMQAFKSSKFFGDASGDVHFISDVTGVTTSRNTGYPRTELREMSGSSSAAWNTAGQHTLNVSETVLRLPPNRPAVVIAQIKSSIGVMKRYPFLKMKATVKGSTAPNFVLEARVKYNDPGSTVVKERGLAFSRRFALGERIDLSIVVSGLQLQVSARAAGEAWQTLTHDYSAVEPFSTTSGDLWYFKAGNYCGSNLKYDVAGEQCEVALHSIALEHSDRKSVV